MRGVQRRQPNGVLENIGLLGGDVHAVFVDTVGGSSLVCGIANDPHDLVPGRNVDNQETPGCIASRAKIANLQRNVWQRLAIQLEDLAGKRSYSRRRMQRRKIPP